jgi:hypothetical protein
MAAISKRVCAKELRLAATGNAKLYVAVSVVALIVIGSAAAYFFQSTDHLMPDGNGRNWGVPLPSRIADKFQPDLGPGVQAAVIVNPELDIKKFVTGVKEVDGKRAIFGAELDNSSNEVHRCELQIGSELGDKIVRLWQRMLRGVRSHPDGNGGFDGTDYYFSAQVGNQTLTGQTWSPRTPKTRRLTAIASTMKVLCQSGDRSGLEGLEYQVDDLLRLD